MTVSSLVASATGNFFTGLVGWIYCHHHVFSMIIGAESWSTYCEAILNIEVHASSILCFLAAVESNVVIF